MCKKIFLHGKWLCPRAFLNEKPVNLLHKQRDEAIVELPEAFQNLHMLVRKSFALPVAGKRYTIRITADDYYKLFINGKYVCQGPAQGYYFNYYWNEVDITDYLREGRNEIQADVYYQGLINRAYCSGDRRMGMIAELWDEGACVLATDATWEYTMSGAFTMTHKMGYDTLFAENYDSRWKPVCWEACCVKETDYTFSTECARVLQVYKKNPISRTPLTGGGFLFDFGEEITASLQLTARGGKGQKIRILCGEELEDSPLKVRYDMRCNCLCEDEWTLEEGENVYTQYDYRAFRYVALIPQEGAHILEVGAMVRHYPFAEDYCRLETDSEVLKAVWDICRNAVKYGSQEVYVDCPMRERGQYAGDLTISSASQVILTGDTSLFRKAIDNQMQSAHICKGLMAVTPGSLMQEIADYSLQFPILALRYYGYTGDKEYLYRCLAVCDGILEHFQQFAGENGLLEDVDDKWNLVDWPKQLRDDYDFPLSEVMKKGCGPHNVINAFYIGCMKQTEEICELLEIEREKKSGALCEAFHRAFFQPQTGLYTDSPHSDHSSLHANAIVAFYGICRPEEEGTIGDFLMQKGLCCGVYMAYFVLKALCRMGRYEDAYQLIVSTGEHSWYNMVREGATTCFEAWGKEQKWNTSLCHPWASAPIPVLVEDILPHMPWVGKVIYKGIL